MIFVAIWGQLAYDYGHFLFHFSNELLLAVLLVSAALADLREAVAWKDSIAIWTLQTRTLAYWMPKGVVLIGLVQEGCLNILHFYWTVAQFFVPLQA